MAQAVNKALSAIRADSHILNVITQPTFCHQLDKLKTACAFATLLVAGSVWCFQKSLRSLISIGTRQTQLQIPKLRQCLALAAIFQLLSNNRSQVNQK